MKKLLQIFGAWGMEASQRHHVLRDVIQWRPCGLADADRFFGDFWRPKTIAMMGNPQIWRWLNHHHPWKSWKSSDPGATGSSSGLSIDAIYASPFIRCLQTVAPLAKSLGVLVLLACAVWLCMTLWLRVSFLLAIHLCVDSKLIILIFISISSLWLQHVVTWYYDF